MSACVEDTTTQDDLEFGIIDENLTVTYGINPVNLDKHYEFKEGEYKNPLYVDVYDNTGNMKYVLDSFTKKELYSTFKYAHVIVMRDDYDGTDNDAELIFSYAITDEIINKLKKHFTLIKVPNSILNNNIHYKNAVTVDDKFLLKFTGQQYDYNEIVIPMYEFKESTAHIYLGQFKESLKLGDVENTLSIMNIYGKSTQNMLFKELKHKLTHLRDSSFWKSKTNCNLNMTESFLQRNFNYHEYKSQDILNSSFGNKNIPQKKDVRDVLNKLSLQSKGKVSGYNLPGVERFNPKYTDIGETLKKMTDRTYYAKTNDQLDVSIDTVNKIFDFLDNEKDLFVTFNTFLVSKNLCHFVLNNSKILDKMNAIINKHLSFYRYIIGYAWLSLYIDECILKNKVSCDSRFIFDINTASKLPFFPVCPEDLHLNPYITVPISKKLINGQQNFLSVNMINDYGSYGISTLDEFKQKFNIFTTGNEKINIFDGINWDNFAVSGSVMTACVPKRSPLIDIVAKPNMTETEKYAAFFNQFYSNSDIDLMCKDSCVFSFMDKVNDLISVINANISRTTDNENTKETVEVVPLKSMAIIINPKYIAECIEDIRTVINEPELTVENVCNRIDDAIIREYFYDIYIKYKMDSKKIYRDKRNKNNLYNSYFKLSDMDDMNIKIINYEINKEKHKPGKNEFTLYYNDVVPEDRHVSEEKNIMLIKISENMKFKLNSSHMSHPIEVFRIDVENYFSTVAKFHLPCVRSYYDGNNVFMLASCVTAMLTGINIEYKYFAGVRDPVEILLKYQSRGFGTILNDNEKYNVGYYCSNIDVGNGFFGESLKYKENLKKMFGPKSINDNIFRKGLYIINHEDTTTKYFNSYQHKYINDTTDVRTWYNVKNPENRDNEVDFLKLKCIGNDGNVTPYKQWVADSIM